LTIHAGRTDGWRTRDRSLLWYFIENHETSDPRHNGESLDRSISPHRISAAGGIARISRSSFYLLLQQPPFRNFWSSIHASGLGASETCLKRCVPTRQGRVPWRSAWRVVRKWIDSVCRQRKTGEEARRGEAKRTVTSRRDVTR